MKLLLKPYYLVLFLWLYITKVVQGSFQVGILALRAPSALAPKFISIPLTAKSDMEILLLANLISMTPGTLSVDVSEDRSTITIHCLNAHDEGAVIAEIKGLFERRVMELLR